MIGKLPKITDGFLKGKDKTAPEKLSSEKLSAENVSAEKQSAESASLAATPTAPASQAALADTQSLTPLSSRKGIFITLEGGEGAGKSTQQKMLAARLRTFGFEVVETREPGGTIAAEILRHCLLMGHAKEFGGLAEALIFNAARLDHIQQVIKPALARGAVVICDRFSDSTKVYQQVIGKVSKDHLTALENLVLSDTLPDLTLVLDLDVRLATVRLLERNRQSGATADRFEAEDLSVHQALRAAFLKLVNDHPQRCVMIDASCPLDAVHQAVFAKVAQRFMRHHPLLAKAWQDILGDMLLQQDEAKSDDVSQKTPLIAAK